MTASVTVLAQIGLGVRLQLLQDHGGDLLRGVALAVDRHLIVRSPMWRLMDDMVRSGLVTAWRFATWPTIRSPVLENATTDGVVRCAFRVGDDNRLAAFHNGNTGIGSTKVDTDNLRHNFYLLLYQWVRFYKFILIRSVCHAAPWRTGRPCRPSGSPSETPDSMTFSPRLLAASTCITALCSRGIEGARPPPPKGSTPQFVQRLRSAGVHDHLHALLVGRRRRVACCMRPLQVVIDREDLRQRRPPRRRCRT